MVAEVYKLKENSEDKLKALEMAIGQIEKSFGKGSVMKLGQNESVVDIEAISSGSLSLDIALGIGGFRIRRGTLVARGKCICGPPLPP